MKKTIFPLLLLLLSLQATAQGRFFGGDDDGYATGSSVNQPLAEPMGVQPPSLLTLSVSPNPTADQVVVSLPKGSQQTTVEVTDLLGRTVIAEQAVQGERHVLHLGSLAAGSYLVVVRDSKGTGSVKVVKE
jgi:hypothetical protein